MAFELLEKLYSFLLENNPLSVTQNIKEPNSINFVLTNKEEFRNLSETTFGKMLMVKKDLPSSYEEIALYLGINIEEYTIHDRFTKYFLKVKTFGVEEMLGRF